MLQVSPIKTPLFRAEQNLTDFILSHTLGLLKERQILAVTSKIVSLSENRLVSKKSIAKEELVKQEADIYLGKTKFECHLTIKEGLILPSAGIDESNSETDDYILYPTNPFQSAKNIYESITRRVPLTQFGILLTDSHTTPLRRGVSGVALAYYGFQGVNSKIGEPDLFGRELKMTSINVADSLATAATLMMGEGNESCPLALISYDGIFLENLSNDELKISPEEDLYWPILNSL